MSQGQEAELASVRGLVRQAELHAAAYKRERDDLLRRLTATEAEHSAATQRLGAAQQSALTLALVSPVTRTLTLALTLTQRLGAAQRLER